MPNIVREATIDVRAAAAAVYAIVEGDIVESVDDLSDFAERAV